MPVFPLKEIQIDTDRESRLLASANPVYGDLVHVVVAEGDHFNAEFIGYNEEGDLVILPEYECAYPLVVRDDHVISIQKAG